jgi:hypothetical protein
MQKTAGIYWALGLTVLCGCAVTQTAKRSEAKLAQLKTGDSRAQVIQKLGPPHVSQSVPTGAVQYDQYRLFPKKLSRFVLFSGLPSATIAWWKTSIWEPEAKIYWLKYTDQKLEKWGPQENFANELPTSSTGTVAAVAISSPTVTAVTVSTSVVVVSTAAVTISTSAPVPSPAVSTITPQNVHP